MKVLLVNGSPHREGCTYTALCAVSEALNQNGIDTDTFWIGNKPISGCIACHKCNDRNRCVFEDTVNDFLSLAEDCLFLIHHLTLWQRNPERGRVEKRAAA